MNDIIKLNDSNLRITTRLATDIKSKFPNLKYEIGDDFIGVFDGLFSSEYCKSWVNRFETLYKRELTFSRTQYVDSKHDAHSVEDDSLIITNPLDPTNDEWNFYSSEFLNIFWNVCHALYAEKFSILKATSPYKIFNIKIQRTPPGGGYHVWHYESTSRLLSTRILVFIMYLNTIEDGGETEFLYLKKRIKPVEGRLILWPTAFSHTHRGNPPLKDTKYVVTGWLEL